MKTHLALALALTALLGTGVAKSAPILKGDITVNKAVVTIGDLFDDAGLHAETGIFLAPRPGTTGIVALADVERAAAMAGLTDFDNVGYTRVRVMRAATIVDATALNGLIEADLRRQGILPPGVTADIRYDVADLSLNAEAVANPASLISLRQSAAGTFAARFAIAGIDKPVDVSGAIQLMTTVPRLNETKPAGTILSPADFELAPVPLATADAGNFASLDDLVGKQLLRTARTGLVLKASDVSEPTVVTRNSVVTVILKSGPMTLTVRGTALTTAAAGQPVDVLNSITKKILHGIARPDGAVEIVTATKIAGL